MSAFYVDDAATKYIAHKLTDPFTLLDIGCSGGIHPAWRAFGDRLRAYAFDPNIEEIARLRKKDLNSGIIYEEGFVGVPVGHPLAATLDNQDFFHRSPWARLSVAKTLERRSAAIRNDDNSAFTSINLWNRTQLTSRSPIYLPDYLREKGMDNVDFVKLDIDGADFVVLQTLFESPLHTGILGAFLEVNFFGDEQSDHHTFHNTDRLMRKMGFELFDLSVRKYSSSALPWPYCLGVPAQTVNGRPFQGDALYMRDITAPEMRDFTEKMSPEKIAKVAAIFSMSGHYDQSAEVLETFAARLNQIMEVSPILDILTAEIQKPIGASLRRSEYLQAFEADDPMFYPGWTPPKAPDAGATGSGMPLSIPSKSVQKLKRRSILRRLKRIVHRIKW